MKAKLFLSLSLLSLSLHASDTDEVPKTASIEVDTSELIASVALLSARVDAVEKQNGVEMQASFKTFFEENKSTFKGEQGLKGEAGVNGQLGEPGAAGQDGAVVSPLSVDAVILALTSGDTGKDFFTKSMAFRAASTTKSFGGVRKLKDEDQSDAAPKRRIGSLRKKRSTTPVEDNTVATPVSAPTPSPASSPAPSPVPSAVDEDGPGRITSVTTTDESLVPVDATC